MPQFLAAPNPFCHSSGVAIFPGHMAVRGLVTIEVGKSAFIADSPPSEPDVRIYRIRLSG
jgi:hypothetical protein